ncbi:MAG: DUF547 domain-containing protein [Alphaproteobacteria bacterium]
MAKDIFIKIAVCTSAITAFSATLSADHNVPALSRAPESQMHSPAERAPEPRETKSSYFVAQAPGTAYQWDMILEKYVSAPDAIGLARFNYGALRANAADQEALKAYITDMEAVDPKTLSEAEAIAFWANLYNAVTISVVIDNYPVKSIKEIKSGWRAGPWKKNLVTVAGENLSLDNIEHDILRKNYPSPLIHYMVNCASIGCPNLPNAPWTAENYDADRKAAARAYINSPRGVRITDKGLKISSIYKWYKEDFGGNNAGILAHLRTYADDELAAAIDGGVKIVDDGYSWSLNE